MNIKLGEFVINGKYTYKDLFLDNKQLKIIIKDLHNYTKKIKFNFYVTILNKKAFLIKKSCNL